MFSNPKIVVNCLVLACAAALPAAVSSIVSESFESRATDFDITTLTQAGTITWGGFATIAVGATNPAYAYARSATGYPISGDHAKVLAVNGELTLERQGTLATEPAMVDMMVQAVVPEEALEIPSDTTPQIAVGVDQGANNTAILKAWCKTARSDTASWVELKTGLTADSWHRVSFLCDYTNGRCQIRIDGEPCVTANGYQQATGNTTTGSWYTLANGGTALNGVKVLGLTQIDDVVVQSGSEAAASYSVAGTTDGVDNSWYDQYGIAWNASATYENESGLTAGQKFAVGLDPFSTTQVKISGMTMGGSKSTFTVPSMGKATQLAVSSSPNFTEKQVVSIPANTTSVTAPLDKVSGDVNYFRIESADGTKVTGDNTCGWVKITSALVNTVIGVPWMEVGSGDPIKVANLVKTDNLSENDMLYAYLGKSWYAWKLQSGAWSPVTTVSSTAAPAAAAAPTNQDIARGAALFIQRQHPTDNSGNAVPFYVYGQYTTAAASTKIAADTAPTYTLCASPVPVAFDLNGLAPNGKDKKISNPGANDMIVVPQANGASLVYMLKDGQWGYYAKTQVSREIGGKTYSFDQQTWTAAPVIPLGQGFWYVSKGGSPTINW